MKILFSTFFIETSPITNLWLSYKVLPFKNSFRPSWVHGEIKGDEAKDENYLMERRYNVKMVWILPGSCTKRNKLNKSWDQVQRESRIILLRWFYKLLYGETNFKKQKDLNKISFLDSIEFLSVQIKAGLSRHKGPNGRASWSALYFSPLLSIRIRSQVGWLLFPSSPSE